MSVKPSGTGAKILHVLDGVARNQPIGVSELSRLLDEDKSRVQRMLVTLAQEGWIRPERNGATKWRMTQRVRILADLACPDGDLKSLAREALETLRDSTGETISLILHDSSRFIVIDVAESHALLRAAPRVGQDVPGPISASSLAAMPYLPRTDQIAILGREPAPELDDQLHNVRHNGYAVLESERGGGTVSVASAILDQTGTLAGVLVLSAPLQRLSPPYRHAMGETLRNAASAIFAG